MRTAQGLCGIACDAPGICVPEIVCGGLLGSVCPDGLQCFDDPRDECNERSGGADCIGLCL